MELSREARYKLYKIAKVLLWTVVPYILIKVPQELLALPEFAEFSFVLNILIYIGKTIAKEPSKSELQAELKDK